jgi:DUF4097 and DUF4098 domain-containing protein YvlB
MALSATSRRLIGALFALVVILYPTVYGQDGDRVFDETYAFSPGDELSVATSSSDVFLRAGSGNEARVEVLGKGGDVEDGFERLNFSVERDGRRLIVKTERESGGWFNSNRASFDIVITAPERLALSVATSSGDVEVRRLEGAMEVATSSGDLELGTMRGPVSVATSSGDVEADRIEGALEFSTSSGDFSADAVQGTSVSFGSSSGDFEVDRIDTDRFEASTSSGDISVGVLVGNADISTSSGDVEIDEMEGALAVATSSGDVEAGLTKPGAVEISTGSGGVELSAPSSLAADVEISAGSIRIDRAFPFAGEIERRSAEGRIGGGGQRLHIETGSGRVVLSAW